MCQHAVYARNNLHPLHSFPLPSPYVLNPPLSKEQLIIGEYFFSPFFSQLVPPCILILSSCAVHLDTIKSHLLSNGCICWIINET